MLALSIIARAVEESLTVGYAVVALQEEEDSRGHLGEQGQEDAPGVEEHVAAHLHGSDGSDPFHRVWLLRGVVRLETFSPRWNNLDLGLLLL